MSTGLTITGKLKLASISSTNLLFAFGFSRFIVLIVEIPSSFAKLIAVILFLSTKIFHRRFT
jgi:hypothetical protein